MDDKRKLSKAMYLTAVCGQKYISTRSDCDIYTEMQFFQMMHRHNKGSNRPRGWFHRGYGHKDVEVRWLWTEKNGYFAPEISFRPERGESILPLVVRLTKAIKAMVYTDREGPESLIEAVKAYVVEYVNDQAEGCWDDYRLIRAPGDNEMMVLARAAVG